jgi:hypothetical protein
MNKIDKAILFLAAAYYALGEFKRYLLHKPRPQETPWPKLIICRWRGHKDGVIWTNITGLEPDMHCKNCGEDLA